MRNVGFVMVTLVVLLGAIGGAYWLIGPMLDGRILPGVSLWRMPLGGATIEEARQQVLRELGLDVPRVVLLGPDGQRWIFSAADLGVNVDMEATLARVYGPGHSQKQFFAVLRERWQALQKPTMVAPVLVWEKSRALEHLHSLSQQIDSPAQDAQVYLDGAEVRWEPSAMGRRLDISTTLTLLEPYLRVPGVAELSLIVGPVAPQLGDAQAAQALEVARRVLIEPAQLLVPNPLEGDPGPWTISPESLAAMLAIHVVDGQVTVGFDEAALREYLAPLAMGLHRDAVDAQYRFDGALGQLIVRSPSSEGRVLDVEATMTQIATYLQTGQHLVPLVLKPVPPRYSDTATAEELGIVELIAVGESYFAGSSSARDHNIRVGSSKFNGILVAPGETFSFNAFLGEVTQAEGYDESYVIVGNRTVPGIGGGICQVATTAFRAAFFAGYPIIERWPHAYRVGYYELGGYGPGFDATIYSPLVDLRFTNDTPYHLLIQTEVDSAAMRSRFLFYSTSMGRQVEQIGPTAGPPERPGAPVYEYDASLPSGTYVLVENPHDGLTAVLERVVRDAEGEVLTKDRFVSRFVPWPARYRFGPGFVPPPDAQVIGQP